MTLAENIDAGRTGNRLVRLGLALLIGTSVSGCGRSFYEVFEGTQPYSGPDSVIATAEATPTPTRASGAASCCSAAAS